MSRFNIESKPAGKKSDKDLPPIVQGCLAYFPKALLAVADVSKMGALKYNVPYADKNWARVPDGYNRYTDALGRHLAKEHIEGLYDAESNLLHAAHAAWDALARLELLLNDGNLPARGANLPIHVRGNAALPTNVRGDPGKAANDKALALATGA